MVATATGYPDGPDRRVLPASRKVAFEIALKRLQHLRSRRIASSESKRALSTMTSPCARMAATACRRLAQLCIEGGRIRLAQDSDSCALQSTAHQERALITFAAPIRRSSDAVAVSLPQRHRTLQQHRNGACHGTSDIRGCIEWNDSTREVMPRGANSTNAVCAEDREWNSRVGAQPHFAKFADTAAAVLQRNPRDAIERV